MRLCVGGAQPQQETLQRKRQIPAVGLWQGDQGGSSACLSAEGPTVTAEGKKHSSEVTENPLFALKMVLFPHSGLFCVETSRIPSQ